MQPSLSQASGQREVYRPPESTVLNRVLSRNHLSQVRREIGIIAGRSYREHLINDEAYFGYRELAQGQESHEMSAEMLENTRKFAEEHELKAYRVHQKIEAAVRSGYASANDEEFLMEKLVVENIKFVSQAEQVEGLIEEKLARMKKDRELYDKLAAHKLIHNIGYLKVNDGARIPFPKLKTFLEMTVPERRKLLSQLQEALPEAEKNAEQQVQLEDKKLKTGYKAKLDGAKARGIIGSHTYKEFWDGFQKIDHEDREYWDAEFDAQMGRYEVLWDQIRTSLRGPALNSIEAKRDKLGYTELFTEFGKLKTTEAKRLNAGYVAELEEYRQEGIIGRHTEAQFVVWMNQQDLENKYYAAEQLPQQMERYQQLWKDINTLDSKQQDFLKSKIDIWGYTEMNQSYKAFKSGEELPEEKANDSQLEGLLKEVQSGTVRQGIKETEEMLSKQGVDKKRTFIHMLDKMFSSASSSNFDATSFESQVRTKAKQKKQLKNEDLKSRAANSEVDFSEIDEGAAALQSLEGGKVIKDEGFIEVASTQKGETHRSTQVQINAKKSVDRFFVENAKRSYSAAADGGKDDMSLSIWAAGGRIVEMDLQEIRVLHEYLKKKAQDDESEKQ